MLDSRSIDRRMLVASILFVASLFAIALLAFPRPAAADCPITGCQGGGGDPTATFTNHLTVTRPATGTITSTPTGISCPAGSGGTCSIQQSQTVPCPDSDHCQEPTDGWDTYSLTASGGPSGFGPSWSGACSGTSCSVSMSADRTVSLSWVDVTNPTVHLIAPARSGRSLSVSATASDNAGVASVKFLVDGVVKASDATPPYGATIDMSGYADTSTHTVAALATDTSNRITEVTATVKVDKSVSLTVDSVPGFTNALALPIGFSTDSDGVSVRCSVNGATATVCSSPFSPPISSEGAYTVHLTAIDDVGNTASASRSFVVDRTAPDASFNGGPAEGQTVLPGDVTVGFLYSDASPLTVACEVDAGAFGPCGAPNSHTLSGLPAGPHSLTLKVTDAAGNATAITRHFTVAAAPGSGDAGGGNGAGAPATSPGSLPGGLVATPKLRAAKLSSSFRYKGKNTMVKKLVLRGLPTGAKVRVRCKGHGCPFKSRSFKPRHGTLSLSKAFKGRKLAKGARVEIRITLRGAKTQVFKLTMRTHRKPLQKTA